MHLAKKDGIITNVKTLETENIFLYWNVSLTVPSAMMIKRRRVIWELNLS